MYFIKIVNLAKKLPGQSRVKVDSVVYKYFISAGKRTKFFQVYSLVDLKKRSTSDALPID
jgi:hypothetical protein